MSCSSKTTAYSIESCSRGVTTKNVHLKITTGGKTEEECQYTYQEDLLNHYETIIQNRVDPTYKREELIDRPTIPAVPGTGAIGVTFTPVNEDTGYGATFDLVFDQISGDFLVSSGAFPLTTLPYSQVISPAGATIDAFNVKYNTSTGIVTLEAYYDDNIAIDFGNVTRRIIFNLSTVLANASPPVDAATAFTNFSVPIFRHHTGVSYTQDPPSVFVSPYGLSENGISFASADSYKFELTALNPIDFGGTSNERIFFYVKPGDAYQHEITTDPGTKINLFHDCTGGRQTVPAAPSATSVFNYLTKVDTFTQPATVPLTDPNTTNFIKKLTDESFPASRRSAERMEISDPADNPAIDTVVGTGYNLRMSIGDN